MTARHWLAKIARNIWLTKIARNRISHSYPLILIPSSIGELLLKKRGCEIKESDEVIYMRQG